MSILKESIAFLTRLLYTQISRFNLTES